MLDIISSVLPSYFHIIIYSAKDLRKSYSFFHHKLNLELKVIFNRHCQSSGMLGMKFYFPIGYCTDH